MEFLAVPLPGSFCTILVTMVAFLLLYFLLCRISTISPISTSSFSSCAMKRVVLLIKWCFANFKLRIQYGTSTVGVRLISFTPRVTYRSWQSSYCSEKRIFLSKMDQPCAFSSPNPGRRVNFAHQFFVITRTFQGGLFGSVHLSTYLL